MAALSDYLESGILNHIFRNNNFTKPTNISIALTSGIPKDWHNGSTIPELPTGISQGINTISTNYSRINLGNPSSEGNNVWNNVGIDETTPFSIYSNITNHSGYFYPLYLNSLSAESADQDAGANIPAFETFTFNSLFGDVEFYAPFSIAASGEAEDPGYNLYENNGFIKNASQILFNTALTDWGWVSGVAILDSNIYGSGNLLIFSELTNPRIIYTGDSVKFDTNSLEINLN